MLVLAANTLLLLYAQAGGPGRRPPPPLEFESDAPAFYMPLARSPRLVVSFGNYTSYQVNVDAQGGNIVGDAANEPSICVDPTNPNRIAIGWRQFDSVSSNFRQAGYAYSGDRGLNWTFPGKLENNVFRSDPVLASRYDGAFYYLSLLSTFYDTLWSSFDHGATWLAVGPADGGDKQWFAVDNTASSGRGFLYQTWSTGGNNWGGRQFTRSTNGGATWLDPINILNQPFWGTLDVDSSGVLYVGGWSGAIGGFTVARSSNARNGSVAPTFDLASPVNLGGSIEYGSPVNPGGLSGQMWVAVDRSSSARPNPVYALCSVRVNNSNPADVMIARSVNGGANWGAPVRVNDDAPNSGHYHWFGALAVSPEGRLDVVWNDTRDDPSGRTSALYYAYSVDGGQHFSRNVRLTPSFNQSVGYPNQNKMGDYLGVVSNSLGVNVAFAATFNNEEDVYYMYIPPPTGTPYFPAAIATLFGSYILGDASSVSVSDGIDYLIGSAPIPQFGQAATAGVQFFVPRSPAGLSIDIQANSGGNAGGTNMAWLHNWVTGNNDLIGSVPLRASGSTDQIINVRSSAAPKYVGPDGEVDLILRGHFPVRPFNNQMPLPFTYKLDLVSLLVR